MRTPAGDPSGRRKSRRHGRGTIADAGGRPDQAGQPDFPGRFADPAGPRGATRPRGGSGPNDTPGYRGSAGRDADVPRGGQGRRAGRHGGAPGPGGAAPRRGPGGGPAGAGGAPRGAHPAGGSVFIPGYSRGGPDPGQPAHDRPDPAAGSSAAPGVPGSPGYWNGPSADGTVGKGPVRGYAPPPGQPPPLYPPGQFAAWNRRRDGGAGEAPADGSGVLPGAAASGVPPGATGGRADSGPGGDPYSRLSRYLAHDTDPGGEPGYPVLAVSDPAADVTSTQTWRAIADGRSTGMWAAPAGREAAGGPADRQASRPRLATPGAGPDARLAVAGADPDAGRRMGGGSGPHTGPQTMPRPDRPPRAAPPGAGLPGGKPRAGKPGARRGGSGQERRRTSAQKGTSRTQRRRPASVRLAMAVALLLVLAAAGTLGYIVLHDSARPRPAARSTATTSPSPSPSPSLGPYGHIASRQADPQPLTLAQLYPASFTVAGATVVRTATNLSRDCTAAIVGATLQSAVSGAGCSQVARATYLDAAGGLMGTIGVLNLSTGDKAKAAAQSADATDFISQLAAPSGPAHKIGQGTGIEEAAAKGHYLILIWAELTNLRKPTTQQTTSIENFMTELLQNTANVSLTTRMLSGAP